MKLNLDTMRTEILEHLKSHGLAVFHGFPRGGEHTPSVYWNVAVNPDYTAFVAAAEAAGVRLMTIHSQEFTEDYIEDAEERLEEASLPRDQKRAVEQRLKEMRGYLGFTCQIELSFDLAPRVYIFDVYTEWFDDLNDLLDGIDDAEDDEDEDDDKPLGGSGYFSKN